jgi:hypothetical protein
MDEVNAMALSLKLASNNDKALLDVDTIIFGHSSCLSLLVRE